MKQCPRSCQYSVPDTLKQVSLVSTQNSSHQVAGHHIQPAKQRRRQQCRLMDGEARSHRNLELPTLLSVLSARLQYVRAQPSCKVSHHPRRVCARSGRNRRRDRVLDYGGRIVDQYSQPVNMDIRNRWSVYEILSLADVTTFPSVESASE